MFSSVGYDSIIETILTVNPEVTNITALAICSGDSVFLAGYYQTQSGIYYDSLFTVLCCDSVFETILNVYPEVTNITVLAICSGDSVFLAVYYQTQSGIYYDNLISSYRCDSIIQTTLSLNPAYSSTDTVSLLLGDSIFVGGAWQTQAGVYTDNLFTQFGCDSIVTTVVNIITSIDNIQTSIILIRPNPTSGKVMVELKIATNVIANLTIQDLQGKLILKDQLKSNEKKWIDISSFKNGVYLVKIMCNGKMHNCKLIKN